MKPNTFTRLHSFKWFLFLESICVIVLVTSCGQQEKEKRQHDIDNFKAYVQAHKDSADYYAERKWDELNSEFEQKKAALDKEVEKMNEEMRASYNNTVNEWNSFKEEHRTKSEVRGKVAEMDRLRATLAIEGVRPDYTDLNAKDILREYEHFVNTVRTNKDAYTQEQWTVINVNYKALNGRKREIDNDIPDGDGGKITKLQLEYTGIKAVNRPFADNP